MALAIAVLAMPPARTGSQDLVTPAALPAPGGSFRAHFLASPFGTIHAATFRFSQPVGTATLASSDVQLTAYTVDGDMASHPRPSLQTEDGREAMEINRALKGPRLVPRVRTVDPTALAAGAGHEAPSAPIEAMNARPPDDTDRIDPGSNADAREPAEHLPGGDGALVRAARIYFATASIEGPPAEVAPWPEEAPVIGLQELPEEPEATAAVLDGTAPAGRPHNETIAPKGEVTGEDRRPKSPAELLELTGTARGRHEKCLADAIYFEARGEPVRGQMAVAQVVINRVFSGYYPGNICGVVYQSTRRHRRLRCQFSFTCDGIPDRVTEPDAWDRAKRIARDALDGNFWLDDIGKATHYHARWVHPWWVREMHRLDRIGVHTFYRPRKWGDGAGSPVWGDADATATAARAL